MIPERSYVFQRLAEEEAARRGYLKTVTEQVNLYLGPIEEIVPVSVGVDHDLEKGTLGKGVDFNMRFAQLDDGVVHALADKVANVLYSISNVSIEAVSRNDALVSLCQTRKDAA